LLLVVRSLLKETVESAPAPLRLACIIRPYSEMREVTGREIPALCPSCCLLKRVWDERENTRERTLSLRQFTES